jgi:hypothetical protein
MKKIANSKSVKMRFRKLIIDEKTWIWNRDRKIRKPQHQGKFNNPKYHIKLIMKGSKGEINEKTWQRKRKRNKRLYEVNKWTAKTKENEKKKEEILKK